jgi:hypothetical protein
MNERKLVHGNLTVESVFVDRQGDWKLCGFEHITEYQQLVGKLGFILFILFTFFFPS